MVVFYKLCITEQNAPFKERVLRALHFQKNALSKHPEFYQVLRVASKYQIKDSKVNFRNEYSKKSIFLFCIFLTIICLPDLLLNFQKHQSSETDGNNMKLLYLTDGKEMMDKLPDANDFAGSSKDQNKLVFIFCIR